MTIALIGASGLIGSHLVERLRGEQLLALSRRPVLQARMGWREKVGSMEEWPGLLEGEKVDVAIAAIGTTWAKTPDWDAYERIDRHAVTAFARAACSAGARQIIVVSSAMTDPTSKNRYLAIKGWMEEDVKRVGCARVDIVRPGLLRGERGGERRIKERLGILVSPVLNLFLQGPLNKYQAIDASLVADAIKALIDAGGRGVKIHHNREIRALAAA